MSKYKVTASHLFPKEFAMKANIDGLCDVMVKSLSRQLIDETYGILDREREIILSKSSLITEDIAPTNSVKYMVQINWEPLIRCRDCIYYDSEYKHCEGYSVRPPDDYITMLPDDYCSNGKREDET